MNKLFKIALLFSSVALFSIANAESSRHISINQDNYYTLGGEGKGLYPYPQLNFDMLYSFDNDFSIGLQNSFMLYRGLKSSEKTNNFKENIFGSTSSNMLLGYRILNSDFNLTIFSGAGISFTERFADNQVRDSVYLPFLIWSRYKINNNFASYHKLQYNFHYRLGMDKDGAEKIKNGDIKHEIKFSLGLEYEFVSAGLTFQYHSMLKDDKKRYNIPVVGLNFGFVF